jgi:PAS domain S-box-containing protein
MTPPSGASTEPGPAPYMLDLLDEGMFLVGPKNRIAWINRTLQHSLGVDRDALVGSDAGEFLSRSLLPRIVEEECRRAISRSLRDRAELPALACTLRTADGGERRICCSSRVGEDGMHLVRLQDHRPDSEQEVLETILSYLPETVNILDRDLRYVYVDREFAHKLGREPHEMVGKTWEELGFTMEGAGPYFEKVREVFATGKRVRGEVRHAVIRDGGYSEYISVPIPGPSGRVERVLTVSRDITGRKQAERRMAHERELLQAIIDAIPVMITIYDPNLEMFRFNRALRETLGWTEEDARGGDLMALCYPDPGYREMVGRFMRSLEPGWRDFVMRAKDGSSVESSWANIRLSDDTRVGIGIDIRERKAAERALRESEERYRSLVELMPDAVVVHQDGIIVYVNPACVRIAGGESPEDFMGKPLDLFVSPEYREVVAGQILRMQQEGTATPLAEQELRTLDGRAIQVDITATPILYQGRPSIMTVFRDITERKQAEETLQFEHDQLISIFDGLEQIVYVTDPTTNEILYTNPYFTRTIGRDVIGGLCYREFQGREEPCPFCTNEVILRQKPEPHRWEYYNPILDVHLDIVDRIIRWPDGRDVRLEVAIDITERKRAEMALQESEEQFRALLNATPDATVLIDREGTILALNETMAARSGKSIEDLRGTCAYDLFPPDLAVSRKKWADEAFLGEPHPDDRRVRGEDL